MTKKKHKNPPQKNPPKCYSWLSPSQVINEPRIINVKIRTPEGLIYTIDLFDAKKRCQNPTAIIGGNVYEEFEAKKVTITQKQT